MSVVPANFNKRYRRGIQMALNELTKSALVVDGDLGPKSVLALKAFQTASKLPVTGVYDIATQLIMDPFIRGKYVSENDVNRAARALGTDKASVWTVVEVEANGDGFLPSGDCVILFERHIFYRRLALKMSKQALESLATARPDLVNPKPGGYAGKQGEWKRLEAAIAIDRDAALNSASWGMFQIMGFNCKFAGWATVEQFVTDMRASEGKQLDAFVGFVNANPAIKRALQEKRWADFAKGYNGPNYKINNYDTKLANAYRRLSAEYA